MRKNTRTSACVVVLIDMQEFFLKRVTKENKERIIPNQIQVIDFCAKHNIPLIILEYKDRGRTIKILREKIGKVSITKTITKENNSGFRDTVLDEILKEFKTKNLVLMGINASGCVQDTAIGALYRGYKIITASTVIASFSERDRNLATSKKWYSKNGKYLEKTEDLLRYLQ